LGRPRHLVGHPVESGPPSSQGNIRRELPSLYTEASGRKNVNEKFEDCDLQALNHFQGLAQLCINASPKRFWKVFDNGIRLNSLAFNTFALPRVPARDGHAEHISAGQLEIGTTEHLTCCSC